MEKQPYLRLNFDSMNSGRPLNVEQLVASMKQQIAHDFKGCRLPPVRALAHHLGLSKNTVQTAYDELRAQGLIESKDRSGFFVAEGIEPRQMLNPVNVPGPRLKEIPFVSYSRTMTKDKIFLSSVFIDPEILPTEKLTACFKSVLRSSTWTMINDPQGLLPLREKIALRLRDRGMDVHADHIIITNGSQQAIDLVTRALAAQVVATEEPAYWLGRHLFALNGIKTVGLPVDPFRGLDETLWQQRLLENRPGLVYLTTNFQNPNGYSYSSAEIAKIVQWAKEFNFGILEDDWGAEMQSYSEFKPSLRAMGGRNVLYLNSFTKKLLPSLRIGYLAANEKTIEPLLMAKRVSTNATPSIVEAVLFEFLDRGYYDTHLRLVQEELDIRYEHCLSLLREHMPESVTWTTPGGGPVLWLELPKTVDIKVLQERMRDQGVMMQPSTNAFFGPPKSHGFKIGYAFLSQAEMEEAVDKLARELKRQLSV